MNIVLIGFMGSGKTYIGKRLASRLDFAFIDMDEQIECNQRMQIKDIFANFGEAEFRRIESDTLISFKGLDRYVISTGGGVILKDENRKLLKEIGLVIWLKTSPEKVYDRLKDDKTRPLLQVDDPMEKIKELMDFREEFYRESAGLVVDSDMGNPDQVADFIVQQLNEKGLLSE